MGRGPNLGRVSFKFGSRALPQPQIEEKHPQQNHFPLCGLAHVVKIRLFRHIRNHILVKYYTATMKSNNKCLFWGRVRV